MKTMKRTRWRRGETFSEVLVAVLVVALASMLLAGMYTASMGIDASVKEADKTFYENASKVEGFPTSTYTVTTDPTDPTGPYKEGTLKVEEKDGITLNIPVEVYTENGLEAYRGK